MDLLKAMIFGAVVSGSVAVVIGSQGTPGGQLAIETFRYDDFKFYWSWPMFFAGSGLFFGLSLLQR